jgi:hypothetical protein
MSGQKQDFGASADADTFKHYTLESNAPRLDGSNYNRAASAHELADYQAKARMLTGSDICPPVLYKGRMIQAARIGERELPR